MNDKITDAASGATAPGTLSQAATTEDAIIAALSQLDVANDTHWNNDGKPAMDALNALLPAPITRKEVDRVAPDFRRPESAPQSQPPIDNEHVGDGSTQFTQEEIEANDVGKMPATIGNWAAQPGITLPLTEEELGRPDPRDQRIAALEADLAFLRKQFGWPTKDA